jgi:hypothetical protein
VPPVGTKGVSFLPIPFCPERGPGVKISSTLLSLVVLIVTTTGPVAWLRADAAPIVFTKSKFAIRHEDGKRDLVRSDIHLYDDRIEVLTHGKKETLKSLPYAEIKEAQYSFSKSPRWKSGAGAAVAIGIFAIPLFFMKGKKHWLTIQVEGDYVVLKLDKKIFRELIVAFEAKSGIEVERLEGEN